MKVDRHGQAKILTTEEINLIFYEGVKNDRDRAMFAICLYTACRINECVTLRTTDVYYRQGIVRPEIVFRKGNTKGKLATRCIPVIEDLRLMLLNYYPSPRTWFYFPGPGQTGHICPDSASRVLRKACNKVGIQGVSTHSFRRTALTLMSDEGIPLRIIQEISGHKSLQELQKYLEVKPEQVRGAVSSLSLLSPVKKSRFPDTPISEKITPRNDNSF
ncbi:MAG: site-specific integrase [Xenococcaceae cyanobacterium MO_188.B29]|nr:site-specific integrase [Xenococcaceae cyanobacterium MO_188.B29]